MAGSKIKTFSTSRPSMCLVSFIGVCFILLQLSSLFPTVSQENPFLTALCLNSSLPLNFTSTFFPHRYIPYVFCVTNASLFETLQNRCHDYFKKKKI
jgi:hypothetical protein